MSRRGPPMGGGTDQRRLIGQSERETRLSEIDQHHEIEALREQLAEFEATFAAAAPRLAAFKRLEEIAAGKRTSPEAVAAEAAIEVLERDKAALDGEISEAEQRRDAARRELAAALAEHETQRVEHESLVERHGEVVTELTELLGEMESIRADAVRLVGEREQLGQELQSLRHECEALRAEREVELEARDRAIHEREVAENERDTLIAETVEAARAAAEASLADLPVGPAAEPAEPVVPAALAGSATPTELDDSPAEGAAASPAVTSNAATSPAQPEHEVDPADVNPFAEAADGLAGGLGADDEDDEAFDRFFSDEEAKDGKARDWMLGSSN